MIGLKISVALLAAIKSNFINMDLRKLHAIWPYCDMSEENWFVHKYNWVNDKISVKVN